MAACVAACLLLAVWLQLCSAQTAYIVPDMQADNPSNHSYLRLGAIITNRVMLDDYDTIVLTKDYRIIPTLLGERDPVRLSRNLTITSANYSTEGYKLLELEFLSQRMLIPQGLSLTIKNLGLGRARKTSGQGIPFFVGEGERSLLVLDNVVRIRTACAHNEPELLAALSSIARRDKPGVPDRGGQPPQQLELLHSFDFRGHIFEESIRAIDVRYFVGPVDVVETNYYAGYSMHQKNTTRVCETYVSDECVARKGPEVCVDEQIAILTNPWQATSAQQQQDPQPAGGNLAAIVAPSVVGGVLLVGAAVALALLLRRKPRPRASDKDSLLPVTDKVTEKAGGFSTGGSGQSGRSRDIAAAPALPYNPANPSNLPGPFSGADGSIEHLAIGNRAGSWHLGAFHTAPEFSDATPNDKLKLGVLLGAGSFGRVYKGTWRQLDVAVKVLQHDSSTAAAIANEVDLVMSFRHDNIVRAYYFVTWTRSTPQQDTRSLDQSTSYEFGSTSTATLSAAHSAQPVLLSAGALPKGAQLAPVAECASRGSGARSSGAGQSSKPPSAAGSTAASADGLAGPLSSGSNVIHSAGASTTVRVRIGELGMPELKVAKAPAGSQATARRFSASASGGYSNQSSSNSSSAINSQGNSSVSAGVVAPAQVSLGAWVGQTEVQNSSKVHAAHGSFDLSAGPAKLQEQPQQEPVMPSFVPMMRAVRSTSLESASTAGRTSRTSSAGLSSAAVQLVPYTAALPRAGAHLEQPKQQEPQERLHSSSTAAAQSAAYDVSGALTSGKSTAGVRDPTAGSVTPAGTSSSLIAAAYSSQQQVHKQQTASPGVLDQPVKVLLNQLQEQPQAQPQAQRFVPIAQPRSPSPVAQKGSQSYSVMSQSQSQFQFLWLQNTGSSSGGPSGNKPGYRIRATDEAQTWLIFEYCDGSTLLDLLAPDGPLGPQVEGHRRLGPVLTLLLDIAAGMSYLHSRNVLHGDLKPGNVLIKLMHGAPYGRMAKVSDFGLSRALQAGQSHRSTRTFGTLNHTPPELLRLGRLSPAGDVYSFGILMWEAYTGQIAFQGLHYGEVFEQVALLQRRPDIPPEMPPDYAELVQQCWAADPLLRPPFTTVMQRLDGMLSALMQDEAEAQDRFVSDL